jgi:hypothetical protein
VRLGISTSDKPNARRMAFDRATQALIAAGHVGMSDPYVWISSTART